MLVGPNGAGKTNLIEAISLLAPGRGLRRATLDEVAFAEGDGSWAVSADVEGALGLATLGTGIEPPAAEDAADHAQVPHRPRAGFLGHRVRRPPARDLAHSGDGHAVQRPGVRTPALSRPAGAGGRRRAPSRVSALERSLRSRNRLLEEPRPDPHWLDAIEHETAELAVAVAAQRAETVGRLQARAGRAPRSGLVVPGRRDRARRLDGEARRPAIRRSRSRIAIARCSRTTAPATPPPAARSTGRTSPTWRSSTPPRASPPPMPRPASRRRC